uniref:Uncharacterized protein n=1 Tax=Heterorhabditis bacteriophora TaxID=37862 RepID=A0A1I7WF57_HETBA
MGEYRWHLLHYQVSVLEYLHIIIGY